MVSNVDQKTGVSNIDGKALFRRYIDELANQGNMAVADEIVAESVIEHEPPPPGMASGRQGVKDFFSMLRSAFPDIRITVAEQLADGELVASRVLCRGTHRGTFMGVPASGKEVHYEAIDIVRIRSGMIVEHWGVTDTLALLQQLQAPTGDEAELY